MEAQIEEIEQKAEKKKLEVGAFQSVVNHRYINLQLVELQTELQQQQKQDESSGSTTTSTLSTSIRKTP
jgi:hypothetical protein